MAAKKKKRPQGRPSGYQPEYCEMLIEYMGEGGTFNGFAGSIGVHRDTLNEWNKVHPDFSVAKRKAKDANEKYMDEMIKGHISGKIKGNASVLIFYCKNMRGWRDNPEEQDQGFEEILFVDKGKD